MIQSEQSIFTKLTNDVRFWIGLFFLVRLIGITNPPIEINHNWRQVTGLMVARNYLEVDNNFFHPQVDDNNGRVAIIGMEFPFMNYLVYLISALFGYTHWYGRLLNLIVSSIGIFFFYKLIRKFFTERVSLYASIILLSSIWFSFSRKMMPDTFCISLFFIGGYYGLEYLENGRWRELLLYGFFAILGVLCKIPAAIYWSLFTVLLIFGKYSISRKQVFIVISVFSLIVMYYWYFVWIPETSAKYGMWHNLGKSFSEGTNDITSNLSEALKRFYFSAFYGYVFFVLSVGGLIWAIKKGETKLLVLFIVTFSVFVLYILKSGFFFYHHNYYIIPFVPVLAICAAYLIAEIKYKWLTVLLLFAGLTESLANQQHDLFIKKSEAYRLKLESIADSVSERKDLIVINGNHNPLQLYLSHRKGWNCTNEEIIDTSYISKIVQTGCRYAFVNRHEVQDSLRYKVAYADEDYVVYKLHN